MMPVQLQRWLPILAAILALAFAWVTPIGESPDELGHIRYAEALARGRLPEPMAKGADDYESHQPPLGYVLPALVLAVGDGIDISPVANPALDFRRPGSRAFVPPFASPRDLAVLRVARMTQAIWAAIVAWVGLSLAADGRVATAYLLTPQLLFVCGSVNNDAALVALVSGALLCLVRFVRSGERAALAGLLAAASFFAKASGLLLLLPVAVAAWAQKAKRPRYELLSVTGAGLVAWFALNIYRFGWIVPPVPTASRLASVTELLSEPHWAGSLFLSFWAKFGWLNTPMHWAFYLWFALLTIAAAVGAFRIRRLEGILLGSAVVSNLVLLLVYLVSVDMQPQGRYLLPSIVGVAHVGALSPVGRLGRGLVAVAIGVAIAALLTIFRAFGSSLPG